MKRLDLHGHVVAGSPHNISTCSSSEDEAHTGRPAAMDTIGLDLHKRESQLCIGQDDGTVVERRIATTRERFTEVLGARPHARILLEASTESEWVARHLEALGHEVIVADPNFAPMYATRSRRTKTDRRDARTLMEACRLGAYRHAHRVSDAQRHVRAQLAVRETLVRTRTRYVSIAKALVRGNGLRVANSESHLVAKRIGALELSPTLAEELAPALHGPRADQRTNRGGRPTTCPAVRGGPRRGAARHGAGSRRDHRECGGRHGGRYHAIRVGPSVRGIPRAGARRAEFR